MPATTLTDRALIRLSGEDVCGFLQGLVTNDMDQLPEPLWAALLSAQGKALFDLILWADGDDVLIDCEAEQMEALRKRLKLYRLRRSIAIEPELRLAVHWSPTEPSKLVRHVAIDSGPWPPLCVPDPRLPELGHRWLAPALGEGSADEAWRRHRLGLGVTEGAAELGQDKILWLECNAAELNGVSFTKGCYVGQENTARMNWRQKVNRRLVVVPGAEPGPRTRIHYPELGLAVDHRRVDDLGDALRPAWLAAALAAPEQG